jgi:hypothetical protein
MYATAFRVLAALLQHAPTLRLALPPPPAALPQLMCVRVMGYGGMECTQTSEGNTRLLLSFISLFVFIERRCVWIWFQHSCMVQTRF